MTAYPEHFDRQNQSHPKHLKLKLKGLQPKTIDAYAPAMRRIGEYFTFQVDALSEDQLTHYFTDLMGTHSWSAVKLDLYGLKFFTLHVLGKPWGMPKLVRPPKVSRLPNIVSMQEAQALFSAIEESAAARQLRWGLLWPRRSSRTLVAPSAAQPPSYAETSSWVAAGDAAINVRRAQADS